MSGLFCAQCGEKRISAEDYSLKSVFNEVAEDFAHFDSRILRTIGALLTRPGELSRVYFQGGRSRYTKPLTLFVVLNLMFFFMQPHTGLLRYKYEQYTYASNPGALTRIRMVRDKLQRTGEKEPEYAARFNARLQEQKKSILLFSVPIMALVLALLYFRKGRFYVEHLIFSVHLYAFLLIALALFAITAMMMVFAANLIFGAHAAGRASALIGDAVISVILGSALLTYNYQGLRRAYGDRPATAAVKAAAITSVVLILTGVYHSVLFFTAYFAT